MKYRQEIIEFYWNWSRMGNSGYWNWIVIGWFWIYILGMGWWETQLV